MKKLFFLPFAFIACVSCSSETDKKEAVIEEPANYYQPQIGDTFEWRLNDISLSEVSQYNCKIIDIDAFSATKELVAAFHAKGIKVIAYVSVGTIENYRPDANLLPAEIIGKVYPEWPDERFLNLREIQKMKAFITSRFDMIKEKGFDGIEPDNIDAYNAENGFKLTLNDTKLFCEWIIEEAHNRQLSIGQKNTEELVPLLHKKFDWVLTEDLFDENNPNDYATYIADGKPVFCAEYTDVMSTAHFNTTVCPKATQLKYFAFLKERDLNQWTHLCQ